MRVAWIAERLDGWTHGWLPALAEGLTRHGVRIEFWCRSVPPDLARALWKARIERCGERRLGPGIVWKARCIAALRRRPADVCHVWSGRFPWLPSNRSAVLWQNSPDALRVPLARIAMPQDGRSCRVVSALRPGDEFSEAADRTAAGCHTIWTTCRLGRMHRATPTSAPIPLEEDGAAQRRGAGEPLVGILGGWTPSSRMEDGLWCIDLLRHAHRDIRGVVLGTGPHERVLRRFAQKIGVGVRVRFVADPASARSVLPGLACLYLPSDQPALGSWLLWAMDAGIPLVAADSPWIRSWVVAGENAIVVPSGRRDIAASSVSRLLDHWSWRCQLGAAAARHARKWPSAGQVALEYWNLYQRLVQGEAIAGALCA